MKILNFGSCNIDYVYSLPNIARPGETLSSLRREVFPGGKGLNQSIAVSRAGVPVFHAGCVGEDGAFLLDLLRGSGVDVRYMRTVSGASGHAVIQVAQSGENAIIIHPGANAAFSNEYIDAVLAHFGAGDLVILQNEINGNDHIVGAAAKKGMRIFLNPSPINAAIDTLDFSKISCVMINEHEGEALSGERDPRSIIKTLKRRFPGLDVLLTLGEKGCVFAHGEELFTHPAYRVKALDTTAAGDTFTGYFIAGIARGLEPGQILAEASAAAAISVSRMGASPSIPLREEVLRNMETMTLNPSEITPTERNTKHEQ